MGHRVVVLTCILTGCFSIPGFKGAGDGATSAHDEDKDGYPDDEDTCPVLSGNFPDADHDGIGDDCDPHPNDMFTKDVAVFLTFEDVANDMQRLEPGNSDPLGQGSDAATLGSLLGNQFIFTHQQFRSARVEIKFRILDIGATATQAEVGLILSHGPTLPAGNDDGDSCFFGKLDNHPLYIQGFEDSTFIVSTVDSTDAAYETNFAGQFAAVHEGMGLDCRLFGLSAGTMFGGVTATGATIAQGEVGVKVTNSSVQLEYLYVVGVPYP